MCDVRQAVTQLFGAERILSVRLLTPSEQVTYTDGLGSVLQALQTFVDRSDGEYCSCLVLPSFNILYFLSSWVSIHVQSCRPCKAHACVCGCVLVCCSPLR